VRSRVLVLLAFAVMIIVSTGCNEEPISVGEGILPDEDFVRIDTLVFVAQESFSFEIPIVTSGSQSLFAGETDEHRVESIFRFTTPLTLTPDTISNSEIFEAELFFTPVYFMGDSSESIPLYLHEVISGWATIDFNREVFETIYRKSESIADTSTVLGDTNQTVFRLPRELITQWAQQSEASIVPQGFVLKSDESANGIIGFRGPADDNGPELRIIYGASGSPDTLTITQNARAYAAYMKNSPNLQNNIIMQAGVATRAVLKFDIQRIPKGALIHSAELELIQNPELTILHPEIRDSLFAHQLTDNNKFLLRTTNRAGFNATVIDSVNNFMSYSALVTDIVQDWVTIGENIGFILRDNNETLGLHRASFYTERAADTALRPRLKIIYSTI
jgi:hypothetical protein